MRSAAVLFCALCALLVAAPAAQADLGQLIASCADRDALDANVGNGRALPFRFCDDGVPDQGGTTPNETGNKAVEVPAAYAGAAGLPAKDLAASLLVGGADTSGNIALDVDLSVPDPAAHPPPPGGYPLVVMMHGCCSGNKTGWEGATIDPGGRENWHYNNAWFASRGYVVVNYTSRGFVSGESSGNRGSTGQTQLDSDRFEINDFQHLAGQLADLADIDPGSPGNQTVDPKRIVPTGGSYGGGFSWMALTDPEWQSPGGEPMKTVVVGTKYGWTNLVEALVPNGADRRDALPPTDPSRAATPLGFAKRSIVAALYLSGKTGIPPGGPHATFPPDIDQAIVCLQSFDPFELNPLCATTLSQTLPRFLNERSAYFENAFFAGLANGTVDPVPVYSAGTFTDKLFPAPEHRRMAERLKATVSGYPIQEHYGDYNHFVQNKRKEWADLCGTDRHVCTYADYPDAGGGVRNLNATPSSLAREHGVTTRLNRFIDHYAKPQANTAEPRPAFDVTGALQTCPENAGPGAPLDEPGQRFTAPSFGALAPGRLTVTAAGAQPTLNKAIPNTHAVSADPVGNSAARGGACPLAQGPAGAGVATYDSDPLPREFTMLGMTRAVVEHTGAGGGLQLNARLYDLYPDGRQVLVDRGMKRLTSANGPTTLDLHGAGWRFPRGHRVRIELAQDDDPYIKSSVQPSSLVISAARLSIPVRGESAAVGGRVPGGGSDRLRAGFGRGRGVIPVRRGAFRVRCRATGAARRPCVIRVRVKGRRAGYGRARIAAGRRSAVVRVKLNRRGRSALRKRGRRAMRARLGLVVREPSTRRRATNSKRAKLRARKARRR